MSFTLGEIVIQHAGSCLFLQVFKFQNVLTKFSAKKDSSTRTSRKIAENTTHDPLEMAREQFEIAAKAKCDLGFRWLKRLEEEEKCITNP